MAAVIGSAISFIVMLTHFADRKNTLRLVKPEKLPGKLREILPMLAGASALWFAMPVTELLVALYAAWVMRRETAALGSVRA